MMGAWAGSLNSWSGVWASAMVRASGQGGAALYELTPAANGERDVLD